MTVECAVCYVSDINFLLPSLVSATGLRKFVPPHKADVFIFLIDQEARVPELNRFLKPYSINVIPMDSRIYSGFDDAKFNRSHVSPASLGRFFLDSLLPTVSRRIVYIDGDTWIRRDPSALIDAIVPEGKLAAAEDMTSFRYSLPTSHGRSLRSYFKDIGLNPKNGYFNSGVFAASRDTWRTIASEAFKFFSENAAICRHHDQSALNAVIGDRRLKLSLKWHFQTPFRRFGMDRRVNPHIYHFTQVPKPWTGNCEPWTLYEDYQTALMPFSPLMLPLKKLDSATMAKHNKNARRKFFLLKSRAIADLASRCMGFETIESKAWL